MRKKVALVLCILALATACKNKAAHLPPGKMAPILAELHVADVLSSLVKDSLHSGPEKNYDSLALWTKQILHKHEVSMIEFNQSMDWYRDHPQELDSLYASVIPILEKMKTKPADK